MASVCLSFRCPSDRSDAGVLEIGRCREPHDMSGWCGFHLRAACTVHRHAEAGQQVAGQIAK